MRKEKRRLVFDICNGHCAYCGEEIEYRKMQVDHIKPADDLRNYKRYLKLSKVEFYGESKRKEYFEIAQLHRGRVINDFGSIERVDSIDNLFPACADCNRYKNVYSLDEYRKRVMTLHKRMKYKSRMKLELFRKYNVKENQPFDGVFYFEKE